MIKIQNIKNSRFSKFTSGVMIVSLLLVMIPTHFTNAASLTTMSDTLSPASGASNAEKASTVANHTIVFTSPTGVASGGTIILTFDNATSINAALDFTDIDVLNGASQITLAATPSAAVAGVVRTSATVITFTNGTTVISGGAVITFKIGTNATNQSTGVRQITNGSAGTTLLTISGTFGDTGTIGIPIIADDVVVVNAVVTPSITFTLSQNAIWYGNLRTAGICFAQNTNPGSVTCPTTAEAEAFNMTASTNATSGYIITVQGATLTSGANTIPALGSNTASSVGTSQFGIRLTATGGSGSVTAPYAAAGYAYTGTASTPAQVASAAAPSATTTYSVRYMANISGVQQAGTYTTNHTYVATGTY